MFLAAIIIFLFSASWIFHIQVTLLLYTCIRAPLIILLLIGLTNSLIFEILRHVNTEDDTASSGIDQGQSEFLRVFSKLTARWRWARRDSHEQSNIKFQHYQTSFCGSIFTIGNALYLCKTFKSNWWRSIFELQASYWCCQDECKAWKRKARDLMHLPNVYLDNFPILWIIVPI